MIIINKPEELITLICYLCATEMKVHPATDINNEYFTNCELHKYKKLDIEEITLNDSDN